MAEIRYVAIWKDWEESGVIGVYSAIELAKTACDTVANQTKMGALAILESEWQSLQSDLYIVNRLNNYDTAFLQRSESRHCVDFQIEPFAVDAQPR